MELEIHDVTHNQTLFYFPERYYSSATVNAGRRCVSKNASHTFGGMICSIATYRDHSFYQGRCETSLAKFKCNPKNTKMAYSKKVTISATELVYEMKNLEFHSGPKEVRCVYK